MYQPSIKCCKKKSTSVTSTKALSIILMLENIVPVMKQVYDISYRKEIRGEKVPNHEKIYSIFEKHTDIIVKGRRDVVFGHKVNLTTGKSNLVLDCFIDRGNFSDSKVFRPTLERTVSNYDITPRDCAADGGFASINNIKNSVKLGVKNIVFNKIVGSMKNQASSKNMQTRLKKWRSGIEANISNLKRGFNISRCNWKGWINFQSKVLWSVMAYNIRVMSNLLITQMNEQIT